MKMQTPLRKPRRAGCDMTHLLSLPPDVLRAVLGRLGARHLLVASAACKALRDVAAALPLHPVITVINCAALMPWLARSDVVPRVRALQANNSVWGCLFLRKLTNLERLSIRFTLLNPMELRLLPASLHRLELHRVCVALGRPFYMSTLAHLPGLRWLKLTFRGQDGAGHVFVSGMETLPHLRHLCIRQAPRLVVMSPLRLHTLQLQATEGLLCQHPVHAEHVRLECLESPIIHETCLTAESCAGLRTLDIRCPGRDFLPDLSRTPALERLYVSYDAPVIPLAQLAALTGLRELSIDARYGIEKTCRHASLPSHIKTSVIVAGVPMPKHAVDAFFNSIHFLAQET